MENNIEFYFIINMKIDEPEEFTAQHLKFCKELGLLYFDF